LSDDLPVVVRGRPVSAHARTPVKRKKYRNYFQMPRRVGERRRLHQTSSGTRRFTKSTIKRTEQKPVEKKGGGIRGGKPFLSPLGRGWGDLGRKGGKRNGHVQKGDSKGRPAQEKVDKKVQRWHLGASGHTEKGLTNKACVHSERCTANGNISQQQGEN